MLGRRQALRDAVTQTLNSCGSALGATGAGNGTTVAPGGILRLDGNIAGEELHVEGTVDCSSSNTTWSGPNSLDSSALCLARLSMDGFVSLKGGPEWGSVSTKPIKVTGERLHINCDSWRGRVLAEVTDAATGQAIPGFTRAECQPAIVDGIDEPVRWKARNGIAELLGKTVRLSFHIWNAELYSFWFGG